MSKSHIAAYICKVFLLLLLSVSVAGFLSFQNIYGLFLASLTALVALGVFKNHHWGYFAAAAWGLACYQLAKQGYEFAQIKHVVMSVGVLVVPMALYAHEILAIKKIKNAQKNITTETNDPNMPQ
jgi:hypothetical protein